MLASAKWLILAQVVSGLSKLSGIVYERGVDGAGFARLRSKGDQALFGGNSIKRLDFSCPDGILV